jgi:hypothetical protein
LFSRPSARSEAGTRSFKSLLILNADGVAAELVGDAQGGDVHAALVENLRVGQIGGFVGRSRNFIPLRIQPVANLLRFRRVTSRIAAYQRGLAEPLLVDAGGIHQRVFDDGVHHAHAAFVEDAEQRLLAEQFFGQRHAQRAFSLANFGRIEKSCTCEVSWTKDLVFDPFAQAALEERVLEVLAPQSGEGHAGLE